MQRTSKPQNRHARATIGSARILVFAFAFCGAAAIADTPVAPAATQRKDESTAKRVPAPVPEAAPPARPLRQVALVSAKTEMWPDEIEARGDIMPWQEIRVGTEIGGLRLVSVLVNVGDIVKKGQALARLNPATLEAELDAANAQLMEAHAVLAQALATLERAKRLEPSGGVSQQELTLYETQKQTAAARLNAVRAQARTQQLRLDSATLIAPDDGVISARSQAEGGIVQAGSELFRLIRQGRLEWRAEVKGETLLRLAVGQEVTVKSPLGPEVKGRVRQLAPTIDLITRTGLAYVDLPADTNLKAGLTVSGKFSSAKRKALILPSSAVLHEAAGCRVFKVGADNKVESVDVQIGRVRGKLEEITAGLDANARVIAQVSELLKTGDSVSVQDLPEGQGSVRATSEPGRTAD